MNELRSARELLDEARKSIPEIEPHEVEELHRRGEGVVLLDVRETEEFQAGAIPGAVHLPRGFLEMRVGSAVADPGTPLVVYCAGGNRSLLAGETLRRMGYTQVRSLAGGYGRWAKEGRALEKPLVLSAGENRRYARHLSLPEIGEKGQLKLLRSKVLIIGAGGVGSPAALYLAAAGIGELGLVDDDDVEESNLQRQILHSASRIGTPKVDSASHTLLAYAPSLKLTLLKERVTSANVERLLEEYDVVIDGSDNFPTRYLVSDTAAKLGKPCVHASVFRFDGQLTVLDTSRGGPCYRCLFPEPPSPGLAPSCSEAGVLGVLPGLIGVAAATEAIKLLLGIGTPLIGRLLSYDALGALFREFKVSREPDCPNHEEAGRQ